MAKRLQLRGGTTVAHSVFTGSDREITIDTDKHVPVVHDGVTPGGYQLVLASETVVVVDTIASLKALTVAKPQVWVSGYHTKGDGAFGSNIFEWDSTNVEEDNGGTIIKLDNVATGRYSLRFNGGIDVKWFGAIGDWNGSTGTDNTLAFQSSLDYIENIRMNLSNVNSQYGVFQASIPELNIPNGVFKVSSLIWYQYVGITSNGRATLYCDDYDYILKPDPSDIYSRAAVQGYIKNVMFDCIKGIKTNSKLNVSGNNINRLMFIVDNCHFVSPEPFYLDSQSGKTSFNDCSFNEIKTATIIEGDNVVFNNSFFQVKKNSLAEGEQVINTYGSRTTFNDCLLTPLPQFANKENAWIGHYDGVVTINNCRVGGETGSFSTVNVRASRYIDTSTYWKSLAINGGIHNSRQGLEEACVVRLYEIPNQIEINKIGGLITTQYYVNIAPTELAVFDTKIQDFIENTTPESRGFLLSNNVGVPIYEKQKIAKKILPLFNSSSNEFIMSAGVDGYFKDLVTSDSSGKFAMDIPRELLDIRSSSGSQGFNVQGTFKIKYSINPSKLASAAYTNIYEDRIDIRFTSQTGTGIIGNRTNIVSAIGDSADRLLGNIVAWKIKGSDNIEYGGDGVIIPASVAFKSLVLVTSSLSSNAELRYISVEFIPCLDIFGVK